MSRIIGRVLDAGSGASSAASGIRATAVSDLYYPTILPEPRVFVNRMRTAPGIISTLVDWAQLIVFLAMASVAVLPRLGAAFGTVAGIELLKLATLAKWEVFPQVMPWSYMSVYLVLLIAAGASLDAQIWLSNWVGAIAQLTVAVLLSLASLPPIRRPFVRQKMVEGLWKRGMGEDKAARWELTKLGTKAWKGAVLLTGVWILVFLCMGGSSAAVAGAYPNNQPMPSWFEAVFSYVIPYVALAVGLLVTKVFQHKMAAGARQTGGDKEGKVSAMEPVAIAEPVYMAPPMDGPKIYQAPPRPTPPRPGSDASINGTNRGQDPLPSHYSQIVKSETGYRDWSIATAGNQRVRVSSGYASGRVVYDTRTSHPKLLLNRLGASVDQREGGCAIPLPPGLPVGALSAILAEELEVEGAEFWDCVSVRDEQGLERLRPGARWSRYVSISDVITESMHGSDQGFFVALQPADPFAETWDVYYIQVPCFEDRVAPAVALLKPLKERYCELTATKEQLDTDSARHAQTVVRGAVIGLFAYTSIMTRLIFFDSSWDVMEPITYISILSFGVVASAFYLWTSRTFSYEALHLTSSDVRRAALYKKRGFDVQEWTETAGRVKELEEWIEGVRRGYD